MRSWGNQTFASNCLLARRLAERGVRFIQIYHRGWDHHSNLPGRHPGIAKEVDQGSAALVLDLKQRGLLYDTLVIWGGEFGRSPDNGIRGGGVRAGRDHNATGMCVWLAGGGVRAGRAVGATDEIEAVFILHHEASVSPVWLDDNGRPVDAWGTHFRVAYGKNGPGVWVCCESAGADRKFGTTDDLSYDTRER